jgi:hypothetical protein
MHVLDGLKRHNRTEIKSEGAIGSHTVDGLDWVLTHTNLVMYIGMDTVYIYILETSCTCKATWMDLETGGMLGRLVTSAKNGTNQGTVLVTAMMSRQPQWLASRRWHPTATRRARRGPAHGQMSGPRDSGPRLCSVTKRRAYQHVRGRGRAAPALGLPSGRHGQRRVPGRPCLRRQSPQHAGRAGSRPP